MIYKWWVLHIYVSPKRRVLWEIVDLTEGCILSYLWETSKLHFLHFQQKIIIEIVLVTRECYPLIGRQGKHHTRLWVGSDSRYCSDKPTSGWWCNNYLEKYESQWEGLFPIYCGKIKNVWNHQPVSNWAISEAPNFESNGWSETLAGWNSRSANHICILWRHWGWKLGAPSLNAYKVADLWHVNPSTNGFSKAWKPQRACRILICSSKSFFTLPFPFPFPFNWAAAAKVGWRRWQDPIPLTECLGFPTCIMLALDRMKLKIVLQTH